MNQIIQYAASLQIDNLDALARGTGAAYLLVIDGPDGRLIAKQWHRALPKTLAKTERLVCFTMRGFQQATKRFAA